MKVLLDENIPKKLKYRLSSFDVTTVSERGWNGKKNGQLLALMLIEGIDILLTVDKNLAYQQNFDKYPITDIVEDTKDNSYESLMFFLPQIKELLITDTLPKGILVINK